MKLKENIRVYIWLEFAIWLVILCLIVFGIKFHEYKKIKNFPSYQIFMRDVDGLIVGSPVKYMGVEVGYIKNIKIINDNIFVRFLVTKENVKLPKGIIATVEFNGLGGSKSLDLYPPDKNVKSDKLVVVKPPTRLNDSIVLIGDMINKITLITTRLTFFGKNMGVIESNKMHINTDNIGKNVKECDRFADEMILKRQEFLKKFHCIK